MKLKNNPSPLQIEFDTAPDPDEIDATIVCDFDVQVSDDYYTLVIRDAVKDEFDAILEKIESITWYFDVDVDNSEWRFYLKLTMKKKGHVWYKLRMFPLSPDCRFKLMLMSAFAKLDSDRKRVGTDNKSLLDVWWLSVEDHSFFKAIGTTLKANIPQSVCVNYHDKHPENVVRHLNQGFHELWLQDNNFTMPDHAKETSL